VNNITSELHTDALEQGTSATRRKAPAFFFGDRHFSRHVFQPVLRLPIL
jgi:hypothetical protein